MNENQNKLISIWREILIIIMLVVMIFLWQQFQNQKIETEKVKSQVNITNTLETINSSLIEVKKRDDELYPKIDNNINTINNNIIEIKKIRTLIEKNKPIKELTDEKFKKMDINEVSKYFSDSGFPNTTSNR